MFSHNFDSDAALNRIFFISERLIMFEGLDEVFGHIVKTSVSLTNSEAATVRIFDVKTGQLNIVKGFGLSIGFLSQPPINIGEGITGRVVLEGKPYMTSHLGEELHCHDKERVTTEGIQSFICLPLKSKNNGIGTLSVYRKNTEPFSELDILTLNIFCMQAAEAIEKAKMLDEIRQHLTVDSLTTLLNKQAIVNGIDKSLDLAKRHRFESSLIFIDIDNFKHVNDTHGHLLGDKLLHDFAGILKKGSRKSDQIGRFGGEEFLLFAPHTSREKALAIANKLKAAVSSNKFTGKRNSSFNMTFSAGIASFPIDGKSTEELINNADQAMYHSKRNGKNTVSLWYK